MTEPRFLVLRLGSLGDIVHTFPAVSGLRNSFPNAEIIWLTHPKWEFIVKSSALASEVWTIDTRDWSNLRGMLNRIRQHRFETAIDYQEAGIHFDRIAGSDCDHRDFGEHALASPIQSEGQGNGDQVLEQPQANATRVAPLC